MADDTKIVFAQGDIPTMTKLKSEYVFHYIFWFNNKLIMNAGWLTHQKCKQ